jgi:hypothetical protein
MSKDKTICEMMLHHGNDLASWNSPFLLLQIKKKLLKKSSSEHAYFGQLNGQRFE